MRAPTWCLSVLDESDGYSSVMTREDSPRGSARNPRRELVEKQILDQATRLFAEKGFASTTLQDIADATGLTRPALYHYVANKDELLSRLISESTETPAAVLHEINERSDLGPTEKLRKMATAIALNQAQSADRFKLIIRSEADLPEEMSHTYQQSRRHVLKEFVTVVESGVKAGEFRPVDPRTAALGIIGMLNWVAWWHQSGDPDADRRVATQLADMALRTVAQDSGKPVVPEGPERAISMLREDLDYLERILARDRTR